MIIWTIGHSTRPFNEFVEILQIYKIKMVIDIRHLPGSKKFPHFNKEYLEKMLPENGISYAHLPGLGGLRKVNKNSLNTSWRNLSFRAFADYMETPAFEGAILELLKIASEKASVLLCAELLWWRCHRSMVADYLKSKGIKVIHIFTKEKSEVHRYTSPARIITERLTYHE